jgi:MEMO1 family protein
VPVAVSSYANQKDAEKLSGWLMKVVNNNSLVIFSLDFSHYLKKEDADLKDEITKQLIIKKDIGKIMELNNDNVDCPPVLAMSLLYAQKAGLSTEFLRHENSFNFSNDKTISTTSYFTIKFVK